MTEHAIVKLAEQGDPRAIAFLISRTLQKYGIVARANLKGNSLKILLEGEQVPHQSTMVKLVTSGMDKLNVPQIETVKLYGRKLSSPHPAWRQIIPLFPHPVAAPADAPPSHAPGGEAASSEQAELRWVEFDSNSPPRVEAEIPIFQLDDLDPDTLILLPVERPIQFQDLDPDALILYPLDPESAEIIGTGEGDDSAIADPDFIQMLETESANLPAAYVAPTPASATGVTSPNSEPPVPERSLTRVPKLPKRLTFFLLVGLALQFGMNTLTLVASILGVGSFALYTGLDLSNTNQPFASLLSVVVAVARFIVTPIEQYGIWVTLLVFFLTLIWMHRIHATLKGLFERYPISPRGAVFRLALPILNLWGIWTTFFTLAAHVATRDSLKRSSLKIRRLTGWFCLLLLSLMGVYGYHLWLLQAGRAVVSSDPTQTASLWLYVVKAGLGWLLALVWLRLVSTTWRATRATYREIMAPLLPPPPVKPDRGKAGAFSPAAILLGSGASLLSLAAFNCLLGLIATIVFMNNGLRPESIVPTFYDSESLLTLVLLGSFLCIGLGGFLAAHLAAKGLLHAFGLGILLTLIGIALQRSMLFPALAELPFWFQTTSAILITPAALLGGGLCQWLKMP